MAAIVARMKSWVPKVGGLPREVSVLAAIAFCVALGFGIVIPAIPLFARTFGVTRLRGQCGHQRLRVHAVDQFAGSRVGRQPLRRTHDHVDGPGDRGAVQSRRGVRNGLRATAAAARHRRHRFSDVHDLCHRAVAASHGPGVPRSGIGAVSGRLSDRRGHGSCGRGPGYRPFDSGALLRVRGNPVRGVPGRGGAAAPLGKRGKPGVDRRPGTDQVPADC